VAVSPEPPSSRTSHRTRNRVIVAVVLVGVVTPGLLTAIPVTQRETYTLRGVVLPSGVLGCSLRQLGSQSFPAGRMVHFSWTTTPSSHIYVHVVDSSTGRITWYYGPGIYGSGSFNSTGDVYEFSVDNCDSHNASVTISAYCDFQAPML